MCSKQPDQIPHRVARQMCLMTEEMNESGKPIRHYQTSLSQNTESSLLYINI